MEIDQAFAMLFRVRDGKPVFGQTVGMSESTVNTTTIGGAHRQPSC
jgi:hypothetical protein